MALYLTIGRLSMLEQFQYRAANYFYMIGMVTEPIVYLVVWSTIARSQGGSVGGYTAETFAAYYIVWTLVRNMNIVFTPFGWEERIREGTLSGQLVRPMHPIHYDLGFFAGWKVVVIVFWLPIAAVLALIFDPQLDPRPQQIAVFFVAIWGAYLIRSFLLWMLGMVTFWTTRVSAAVRAVLRSRAVAVGPRPPARPDAGMGAGRRRLLAVPMDVRLPDHGARRADLGPRSVPRPPGPGGLDRRRRARCAVDVAARCPQVHGGGRMRLAWLFLRVGVMNELQYRANFFIQLLQSFIAIATGVIVLALIFDRTDDLAGWTRPQLLVVMGVFTIVGGFIGFAIEPNMGRLMSDVRQGTFDYALTKPVDVQLLVSVREFRIWKLTDVLVGGCVLAWGISELTTDVGWSSVAGFVLTIVLGGVMVYCFWLILTTGAFWFVRMEMLQELFTGLYRAGQYPATIYPGWLRFSLTFLVPLGVRDHRPVGGPHRPTDGPARARDGRVHARHADRDAARVARRPQALLGGLRLRSDRWHAVRDCSATARRSDRQSARDGGGIDLRFGRFDRVRRIAADHRDDDGARDCQHVAGDGTTGSARAGPIADREAAQRRQHRLGRDRDRHHRNRGSAPERRCVGDQADDHEHRADGVGGRAVMGEARHRGPDAEGDSGDDRQHRRRRA